MPAFVATDAAGVQHLSGHDRAWPLPERGRPGGVAQVAPGEHPLVLMSADELLGELGERIFLAEVVGEAGARLVRELDWNPERAAELALDCSEHALGQLAPADGSELRLPDGSPLADIIAEARDFLARAEAFEAGERRIGLLARLSMARRLGREQARVAGLALAETVLDEEHDLDVLDDPEWTDLAALSSALLSAAEVLRHVALPRYVASRERSFSPEDEAVQTAGVPLVTPWGLVSFAPVKPPEYLPAYVSAREAAERARRAVADELGEAAAAGERAYQRRRLLELLGVADEA